MMRPTNNFGGIRSKVHSSFVHVLGCHIVWLRCVIPRLMRLCIHVLAPLWKIMILHCGRGISVVCSIKLWSLDVVDNVARNGRLTWRTIRFPLTCRRSARGSPRWHGRIRGYPGSRSSIQDKRSCAKAWQRKSRSVSFQDGTITIRFSTGQARSATGRIIPHQASKRTWQRRLQEARKSHEIHQENKILSTDHRGRIPWPESLVYRRSLCSTRRHKKSHRSVHDIIWKRE